MPSVTAEAFRDAYARFYAGDAEAHVPLMAEDVVAVDRSGSPDAGTHHGRDEYLAWAQDFLDLFSQIELDQVRLEEIRDDRVLALLDLRLVTDGGGVPVEMTVGHVLDFRDGLIVGITAFIDEQLARDFACE
jgi:ketosteroid isomerase-like protein